MGLIEEGEVDRDQILRLPIDRIFEGFVWRQLRLVGRFEVTRKKDAPIARAAGCPIDPKVLLDLSVQLIRVRILREDSYEFLLV